MGREGSAKHQTAKFLNHDGPAFVFVMLARGLAGVKGAPGLQTVFQCI